MTTQARSIELSVGKSGGNKAKDVKVIQELINAALSRYPAFSKSGVGQLEANGTCDDKTISAIEGFQKYVLGWSGPQIDGVVSPNRQTWKALNGNVSSNAKIKPISTPRPSQIDGYAAFRQGDFSSTQLGNGSLKISGHGCALCTLTMAASVIGSPTKFWPGALMPKELSPPVSNDILRAAGAFSSSNLTMSKASEALGMSYDEYGMRPGNWDDKLDPDEVSYIVSNLNSGNPVAAHVDYKGGSAGDHWILVIRKNGDDTFGCIDPATGRELCLTRKKPVTSALPDGFDRDFTGGVLYGFGQGGSQNQQKYVVKRFALLAPASGGYCASIED